MLSWSRRVKDMLSAFKGVIYMGDRVVVPEKLRDRTLDTLHAAHQGTTSMRLRAERNLFWPNMARDISSKRMSCIPCDEIAPSKSPEPPITPIHPEYPFQHLCSDCFSLQGYNFCLGSATGSKSSMARAGPTTSSPCLVGASTASVSRKY